MRKFIAMCIVCVLCCFIAVPAWADGQGNVVVNNCWMPLDLSGAYVYNIEETYGVSGGVYIKGYLFVSASVEKLCVVDVYRDGDFSTGLYLGRLNADVYRLDVAEWYDISNPYVGFDGTLPLNQTGTYDLYLYGIVDDSSYAPALLGSINVTVDELSATPTPTPTSSPTPVVTPSPTPTTPTVTPEPTATPSPTPSPTPNPYAVDPEDLNGAGTTISDAESLLDSIYDNLPELNSGVLGFMAATMQLVPTWFVAAITLSLILSAFVIFLRFLWQ